jgi:putative redox protein
MSSSDDAAVGRESAPKPAFKSVALRWSGAGKRFEGGPAGVPVSIVDGDSAAGPSPMDHLLLAAAGCMAIDVLDILAKSRVPVEGMSVAVDGTRADKPPRRFTAITMSFHLRGPVSADRPKVERAVHLSRETYCSVVHSLRPDLDLLIEVHLD